MEVSFVAPARDLHGRHCAVRPGTPPDRLGLHFFEYPRRRCSARMTARLK
jgi:hypothetical protein